VFFLCNKFKALFVVSARKAPLGVVFIKNDVGF